MNLEDVQTLAKQTYLNNLSYLEKEQKNLFSKLQAFDSAIDQGIYMSRYELVYEKNYFDVKELTSQKYLYDSNSDEYAQTVKNSINYSKEVNLFKTYKEININTLDLPKYTKLDITQNPINGTASIFHYINTHQESNKDMLKIEKFIFFGLGLAQHIQEVDKKIQSSVYLLVEDNLELFKLSLFVTPYSQLAKTATLIFSIFEDKEEFSTTASKFLQTKFEHNHYLKYFQMLNHSEKKLKEFHIKTTSQSHNLFFYNTILKQYLRPLPYIQEHYKFLNILHDYSDSLLGYKPVLYLAAGPSMLKNIKWIQDNQDKFLIVAVSATLIELYKHNVKPDIVTHLDGFDISAELFNPIDKKEYFDDIVFLLSARTPTNIIQLLNKENIFFFENGTNYKDTLGNISAPCVGATTYLLLLSFGIKNLYLLGLDLAIDSESGYTHAQTHVDVQKVDLGRVDLDEDKLSFRDSLISVTSNFGNTALTNPNFLLSINSINASSKGFKKEWQNVYNLGDGVKFQNTISLKLADIILNLEEMDKNIIKKDIHAEFYKNSSSSLLTDEYEKVLQRYNYTLRVKKILKKQKNIKFSSKKHFLKSLSSLYITLSKDSSTKAYDLSLIYQEYFHFINTFIFDYFNTLIEREVADTNNINNLLCTELEKINKVYENGLKGVIQKVD
ncbi:hypothetical protein MNB_SM-4-453 [hydrothermal vent metagenome]|uniref:6-hydroxymethylpterin diphosphokinase MptE-like domain-containing protein n=1 Tax=hydrothermal vent metagenome TaxID=652676 RepID=A0A1W1BBA6_9ZZZZ